MFDIRLRNYTPEGVKGRVIPTIEIDTTDAESATATLTFSTTARVASRMEAPFVVGLEYTTGSSWSRPRNDLYVVLTDAENSADQTDVMTFTAQSYVGWLLSQALHWWNTDSTDGRTRTYNMTPGRLVRQLVSEAQTSTAGLARGWAPMLTTAFTDTADSLGQAWTTEDQIKMEVDLWRPYSALFQSWIEQGHFEWWAEGTTLMLSRLGTGADLTQKVVFGGPAFEAAQAKTDFKGTFSTIVLIPDKTNATHAYNAGADTRFGALETSMSMSGVSDQATAVRLALPVMKENRAKKLELSFDWIPAAGGPIPWADFTVGDLVVARRKVGKINQRVIGIQVSKREGVVSARAIVGSKLVGLQAKLAKRVGSTTTGGIIGGSGSGIPSNPGVKRPDPIAPTGLNVTSTAYFDNYGNAYASVTATCSTVTTDVLGGTVKITWYELWGKKNSAGESWTRLSRTEAEPPSMSYTGLLAGESWSFKVRAYVDEGVVSAFSSVFSHVLAKDTTPPPTPAAPSGETRHGQVLISHNGLTAAGDAQPVDFSHFNVWMATTATGAGAKIGVVQGDDICVTPNQTYDQARWYWVTAEDKSGNKSGPSSRISVTTKSLVPEDITQDVMDAITDVVSQEVITNGGGTVTWATRVPATADGTGKPVGAVWYRRDSANTIIGMWEWSGSAWIIRILGPDPIADAAITDAKIATGAVLEAKLADAAVATAKLKDSAVTTVKIADLAVGTAQIADAAILTAKIGDLAVSTAKIANAAIVTAKIGDAQITNAKIGDAQITNAKILNVDAGKVTTGFLDAARIDANTITARMIAIGDFTNLASGSDFEDANKVPWMTYGPGLAFRPNTATFHSGTTSMAIIGTMSGTSTLNSNPLPVKEGDQFYVEFWARRDSAWNGLVGNSKLRIGYTGATVIHAVGYALSDLPTANVWTQRTATFTVPAGATAMNIMLVNNDATAGTVFLDDIIIRRMNGGELIVDGSIIAPKIAANAVEADKIAANAVTADKVAAGAITTVKLDALAVTAAKIAADAVDVNKLAANAITSKHTITGALFQTTATATRGIKIMSLGMWAYNSAGQPTFVLDASTGEATFTGTIRNKLSGPRVEIKSSDTQAIIHMIGAEPSGNFFPAQIYSDPVGQSLFLRSGNPNTTSPIYSTLRLHERTSSQSWYLGRIGNAGASAYPMLLANEDTFTSWYRSDNAHGITMNPNGYTYLNGLGVVVNGTLSVTGAKNFAMDHPTKPGIQLVHASTESPLNGVEYWSDGQVAIPDTGETTIALPEYFEALTAPDHRAVILTPGSPDAGLWVGEIADGGFTVHGAPGATFTWLVKARRVSLVAGEDTIAFEVESEPIDQGAYGADGSIDGTQPEPTPEGTNS